MPSEQPEQTEQETYNVDNYSTFPGFVPLGDATNPTKIADKEAVPTPLEQSESAADGDMPGALSCMELDSAIPVTNTEVVSSLEGKRSWELGGLNCFGETKREFDMFRIFCRIGGGRSHQYVSKLFNLSLASIKRIADKNLWDLRVADYDTHMAEELLAGEYQRRQEHHIAKLESYRQEQETTGKLMTDTAMRLLVLTERKLTAMMETGEDLDINNIASVSNAAAKLADTGKGLSSSALGVEALLEALEEHESS